MAIVFAGAIYVIHLIHLDTLNAEVTGRRPLLIVDFQLIPVGFLYSKYMSEVRKGIYWTSGPMLHAYNLADHRSSSRTCSRFYSTLSLGTLLHNSHEDEDENIGVILHQSTRKIACVVWL